MQKTEYLVPTFKFNTTVFKHIKKIYFNALHYFIWVNFIVVLLLYWCRITAKELEGEDGVNEVVKDETKKKRIGFHDKRVTIIFSLSK